MTERTERRNAADKTEGMHQGRTNQFIEKVYQAWENLSAEKKEGGKNERKKQKREFWGVTGIGKTRLRPKSSEKKKEKDSRAWSLFGKCLADGRQISPMQLTLSECLREPTHRTVTS